MACVGFGYPVMAAALVAAVNKAPNKAPASSIGLLPAVGNAPQLRHPEQSAARRLDEAAHTLGRAASRPVAARRGQVVAHPGGSGRMAPPRPARSDSRHCAWRVAPVMVDQLAPPPVAHAGAGRHARPRKRRRRPALFRAPCFQGAQARARIRRKGEGPARARGRAGRSPERPRWAGKRHTKPREDDPQRPRTTSGNRRTLRIGGVQARYPRVQPPPLAGADWLVPPGEAEAAPHAKLENTQYRLRSTSLRRNPAVHETPHRAAVGIPPSSSTQIPLGTVYKRPEVERKQAAVHVSERSNRPSGV